MDGPENTPMQAHPEDLEAVPEIPIIKTFEQCQAEMAVNLRGNPWQ